MHGLKRFQWSDSEHCRGLPNDVMTHLQYEKFMFITFMQHRKWVITPNNHDGAQYKVPNKAM